MWSRGATFASTELRYKLSVCLNGLMNNWFVRSGTLFRRRLRHRYKMSYTSNSLHWCYLQRYRWGALQDDIAFDALEGRN